MSYEYEDDDGAPYVVIEKNSGSVSSFIVGAAIGAAVALLFAPRSGAATRQDLRRRAGRVSRAAGDAVGDAAGRVTDTFHEARRQVEERLDSARQAVEVKKQQVTRAMEAGREAAQQARDELERRIAETKAAYQAGVTVAKNSGPVRAARAGRAAGARPGAPATSARPLDPADAALGDTAGAGPGIPEE